MNSASRVGLRLAAEIILGFIITITKIPRAFSMNESLGTHVLLLTESSMFNINLNNSAGFPAQIQFNNRQLDDTINKLFYI
jgi:hypothetical protein